MYFYLKEIWYLKLILNKSKNFRKITIIFSHNIEDMKENYLISQFWDRFY